MLKDRVPDFKVNLDLKDTIKNNLHRLNKIFGYGNSSSINKNGFIPEGLNYFFAFSFEKVASYNFACQLNYDEIEQTKPNLVIRESVQRNVYEWIGFLKIN